MSPKAQNVFSWFVWFVGVLVVAVLLRLFVIGVYMIPSGSMQSTLNIGDRVLGEKISYLFHGPAAGDVVTFSDPDGSKDILIKRVIAVGGQTVDLKNGVVYVDGQALDEPYTNGRPSTEMQRNKAVLSADITYPYVVPQDHLWVMGDNRTNSADSRTFGSIPVKSVSSHAMAVFWPLGDLRTL